MDSSYTVERGGGGSRSRNNTPNRQRSRPSSGNFSNNDNLIQTAIKTTAKRSSSTQPLFRTVTWILIVLCSSFLSFYGGVWTGLQASSSSTNNSNIGAPTSFNNINDHEIQRRVEKLRYIMQTASKR